MSLLKIFPFILLVAFSSKPSPPSPCKAENELCERYLRVWKNLLLKRNNMSEEYFKKHITPVEAGAGPRGEGAGFVIWYKIKIDWAEIPGYNQFEVKLKPGESLYGLNFLNFPTGVYLSEDEIEVLVNKSAFHSSIGLIKPIKKLKFSSQDEALKALQKIAGTDKIKFKDLTYTVPGKRPGDDGDPYLRGFGTIDYEKNECIRGYINLVTGEGHVSETACWID
jgi:hypothetical protein